MNDSEITALAKGMVPFVRQCVADIAGPLTARLAEVEARPIAKGDTGERGADGPPGPPGPKGDAGEFTMVPPALAAEVASAVRLLHEAPPITPRSERPRVSRIQRDDDGSLVPIYDDEPQP